MRSRWADEAQRCIAAFVRDLPDGASLEERRKLLRSRAHYFHGGTSWGKKVWSREARRHLEMHGLMPRRVEDAKQPRLEAALERGDIIFPFRAKP